MTKRIGTLTLVLVLVLMLSACGGTVEQEVQNNESETSMGESIAIVNGENIYEVEYNRMTERMMASYEQQGMSFEGDQGEEMLEQIQQQTLEMMIQQKVLLQEVQRLGLSPSEESVDEQLNSIRSQFDTDEEYEAALEQNMFSEKEFKETLVQELSIEVFLDENMSEVVVTDDELEEYYKQYKTQQEEQIKAIEDSGEEVPEDQLSMMEVSSFEDMKAELEASLVQQKEQEQIMTLIDKLIEDSDIEILM